MGSRGGTCILRAILNEGSRLGSGDSLRGFSGQESLSRPGLLEMAPRVSVAPSPRWGHKERVCFSAVGAPSGEPGPVGPTPPACPGCTYSFFGCINRTAQPWLPEVPLPGPKHSAPANLALSSQGPLLLLGPQGGLGSGLSGWGSFGGLLAPTQASPTGWAPGGLSVSRSSHSLSLTTVSACALYPINKLK